MGDTLGENSFRPSCPLLGRILRTVPVPARPARLTLAVYLGLRNLSWLPPVAVGRPLRNVNPAYPTEVPVSACYATNFRGTIKRE